MMFFSGRAFAVAVAEEQIFFLVAQVLRATPERQHVLFWSRFFSYTFVSAVRGFFSGRAFSMAAPERRNDFFLVAHSRWPTVNARMFFFWSHVFPEHFFCCSVCCFFWSGIFGDAPVTADIVVLVWHCVWPPLNAGLFFFWSRIFGGRL